jgi:hypothetical protein
MKTADMRIPRKLKVMAQTYTVERIKPEDMIECSMGSCNSYDLEIKIMRGLQEPQEADTFLHEVIEAIKAEIGCDMPHRTIVAISATLLQVIRDNGLDFRKPK